MKKRNVLWLSVLIIMDGSMRGAFAVTPSHSSPTQTGQITSRPRAPQSVETANSRVPALAVVDFITVFGGVPSATQFSVVPQNESERQSWEPKLTEWRKDQADLLGRVKSLVPGKANELTADTRGALVALKGQIEGWQNRDKEAAYGGQVFSEPALTAAQESADFLVSYAESYSSLASDPGLSRADKERKAFETALRAHPETKLSQPSSKELEGLSSHHRDQVKSLLSLRDSLRVSGGMEEFAAMLRKDTRPARRIESVAQR